MIGVKQLTYWGEGAFYLVMNYMTKLKLLIVALVVWVVFILWVPTGHWETEKLSDEVENSNEVVEETIIYTFDMTKNYLKEKVNALVGDYNISSTIVEECTTQVPDNYIQCLKSAVWVANAESTLFTRWMSPTNNWWGLMYQWKKRKFSSVEESIQVWVSLYKKNNWGKRTSWNAWVWTYCMSECKHWAKNYESAIKKLNLD